MSKVLIKTLQQKTFEIEIDHSETVRALKEKIEKAKGEEFQADLLKLIYSGKILDDAQPLTKYKIQPNGFVVVMVSKSRPPPKPAAQEEQSGASVTSAPESSTTTQETTPTPAVTETSQPQQATATTSEGTSRMDTSEATATATPTARGLDTTDSRGDGTLQQAGSALLTGQNLDAAVMTLMEFGYEQELVTRALNASFNNPDRAAEMLMSGTVPPDPPAAQESMEEEPGEQPTRDTPPQQPSGSAPASEGNPFEFLRQRPQFQLLQSMIRENPEALPQLLQQLGQSNPQLLQLINANQQEFINMLNSSPSGSSSAPPAGSESAGGPPVPRGMPPGMPQGMPQGMPPGMVPPGMMPPGAVSIQVTPEEKEAIDRLKALGFPETDVIQAYMACDKNEELAANFLLSDRD